MNTKFNESLYLSHCEKGLTYFEASNESFNMSNEAFDRKDYEEASALLERSIKEFRLSNKHYGIARMMYTKAFGTTQPQGPPRR